MTSTTSLMNKINNRGPRWLPCGTPGFIGKERDSKFLIFAFWKRPDKYDLIHCNMLEWKPKQRSFSTRIWWSTLSNAFLKSVYIQSTWRLAWMLSLRKFVNSSKFVVVDRAFMKPCWRFETHVLTWLDNTSDTMASKTFAMLGWIARLCNFQPNSLSPI